jgi:hypothetical protein
MKVKILLLPAGVGGGCRQFARKHGRALLLHGSLAAVTHQQLQKTSAKLVIFRHRPASFVSLDLSRRDPGATRIIAPATHKSYQLDLDIPGVSLA